MKKGRIEYLDFLKGISILLVVFCHYCMMPDTTILGNIVMCMAWAAVPCFFLVSGGLMHASKKWDWKKYFKKLIRIYVVLVIWKVIYLVVYLLATDLSFSGNELVQYLFFFGKIEGIDTGVMWFMYAYLMALLFYPFTYFLFKGGKTGRQALAFGTVLLLGLCFVLTGVNSVLQIVSSRTGHALQLISFGEINPFGQYGNMLFFFLLGAFLFAYREQIAAFFKERWRKLLPVAFLAMGVCIYMLMKYLECGTWQWDSIYMSNGYARVGVIFMALGLYLMALLIPEGKIYHWIASCIGTNTQGIYYMHYLILAILAIRLGDAYMKYASFATNILKAVVITLLCMVVSMLVKKIPVIRHLMG